MRINNGSPATARAWRCTGLYASMPRASRSQHGACIESESVKFDQGTTRELLETIANTVIGNANELTELDRAIGDADHGVNLDRGFKAVLANIDRISALPIGAALNEAGRTLILTVGGASGPLYGKLFATIGQHLESANDISKDQA